MLIAGCEEFLSLFLAAGLRNIAILERGWKRETQKTAKVNTAGIQSHKLEVVEVPAVGGTLDIIFTRMKKLSF